VNRLTHARIERAIRAAEAGTTGHILVRIVPDTDIDAFARARDEFTRAELHVAPHRNTTLVLVAPKAKKFAVLGDRDIHAHVGDAFWQDVVAGMKPYFAAQNITGGIVHAVEQIGRELHAHFPAKPHHSVKA
jgi:uncharacterized membrane protein